LEVIFLALDRPEDVKKLLSLELTGVWINEARELPKSIIDQYQKRILNIHPSLLPEFGGKGFYGIKVHEAVIASGVHESGVTVHFVDEEYDHGKIIAQEKVKVLNNDTPVTLAERVLKVEHKLFPQVLKAFCENRILWKNNHPVIEVAIEN